MPPQPISLEADKVTPTKAVLWTRVHFHYNLKMDGSFFVWRDAGTEHVG